jgi:two-component system chemotaxis response regulator CheY
MDGITFIKEFRKSDRFTPIIVLTTESESAKISEGKQAGASGWIIKPFKPEELTTAVTRLLR